MVAVKKQVSDYDAAIGVYLDCIKQEHEDAVAKGGDKLTDKQKQDLDHMETSRHNAAVAQLQGIADRFNEQVGSTRRKTLKRNNCRRRRCDVASSPPAPSPWCWAPLPRPCARS